MLKQLEVQRLTVGELKQILQSSDLPDSAEVWLEPSGSLPVPVGEVGSTRTFLSARSMDDEPILLFMAAKE